MSHIRKIICPTSSFSKNSVVSERHRTITTLQIHQTVLNGIEDRQTPETLSLMWIFLFKLFGDIWRINNDILIIYRVFKHHFHKTFQQESTSAGGIFFVDEVNFSRNTILNFHSSHLWGEENSYEITENVSKSTSQLKCGTIWFGTIWSVRSFYVVH